MTVHEDFTLVQINLRDTAEYSELRRQRVLCGWDTDDKAFEIWRQKQDAKLKSFFWITLPSGVRAGHISLDSYCNPPDLELANPDKSVLTIQSFFILPEHRSGGLGRKVMDHVEEMAKQEPYGSPKCRYVTVNTLSKKYYYEENPGSENPWKTVPRPPLCPAEWYERRGYERWKSEPRYPDSDQNGTVVWYVADFMRKAL